MVLVREISAGYRGLPADAFYWHELGPPGVHRERAANHSRDGALPKCPARAPFHLQRMRSQRLW